MEKRKQKPVGWLQFRTHYGCKYHFCNRVGGKYIKACTPNKKLEASEIRGSDWYVPISEKLKCKRCLARIRGRKT
jgi:hypothetical protein